MRISPLSGWLATGLLVIGMTLAGPAVAKTFKIATVSPDGLAWMKQLRAGAKDIEARTEGRVKFKIYPGGVQGDDFTVLRKMRIGQLHGGMVASSSLTRFYPDLQIYSMPLQFRDNDEVDFVRERMDSGIQQGLRDNGLETFHLTETGFAYMLSQTPVTTLSEMQGLKVWVPDGDPIAARIIKSFGVSPIPLYLTDVLAGLQTGLIDAVAVPPLVALALQWHNHVSHMTDLPLMYTYSMLALDKKAFASMSEGDQAIVHEVMDAVFIKIDAANRADNEKAYTALLSQDIERVQPDLSGLDSWRAQADETIEDLVSSDELSQQSVDTLRKNLSEFRANGAGQ
ncbi:MAG: TRAP-type C4-dicarboxylate transport system substrate-binding protein [Candidatus Azotimanducaceae bacterium]|jgi:TRAP-type C4-dicarboxylate transport system substrate-binding protein